MINKNYDVVIVGCGLGGLFSAHTLIDKSNKRILILEKGTNLEGRYCPPNNKCCSKQCCDILCGVGGAGGFSDGKITLAPRIGTHYEKLLNLPETAITNLVSKVLEIIQKNVPNGIYYGAYEDKHKTSDRIKIEGYKGYHIGTDGIQELVKKLYANISRNCEISLNSDVIEIEHVGKSDNYGIIYMQNNEVKKAIAPYVILAPGLEGSVFIENNLKKLGICLNSHPADIGIRIEVHHEVFTKLMDNLYDFKIYYSSSDVNLRTFCVNHMGYVLTENHRQLGISGVNGHAYLHNKTSNTNFAILATITSEYSDDPPKFVRNLARSINQAGKGYPIYQTLDSFLGTTTSINQKRDIQRTNTKVRYANIKELLPTFLYKSFRKFLLELIEAFPKMQRYQSYIYAPEIKYFQYKVPLTPNSNIPDTNIYVIGNASGYTANLMGAAVMGLIAAKDINNKIEDRWK